MPPLERIPTKVLQSPIYPVALGLRTLAKGVTPDSAGRSRPCLRGRLRSNLSYPSVHIIIIIIIIIIIVIIIIIIIIV